MIVFPFCKVNIGLSVVDRRPDGYHNIESLFYPVNLTDVLELVVSNDGKNHFTITGIPLDGDTSQNLCVKAYKLLSGDFPIPPIKFHLHKIIPAGAGLGGGSSDAAFMLRGLNKIFKLGISKKDLFQYAMQIGSDCGFFMQDSPAIVSGRGEHVSPINISLNSYKIVIVKPNIHIQTANAYQGIKAQKPDVSLNDVINMPIIEWQKYLKNDFEQTILIDYPGIAEIKSKLVDAGALYTSMSGSGSAVYGIFEKEIRQNLESPGCFVWSGILQ